MKRYLVDCIGNYIFFVPLVIALTPPLWNTAGIVAYLLAAIPISFVGARAYTFFLKHFWYKFWKVSF